MTNLVTFPIFSNVFYLLIVPFYIYAARKREEPVDKYAWQICFAFVMAAASTFNHLCNVPQIDYCVNSLSIDSLLSVDVAMALINISGAVTIFTPHWFDRWYFPFIFFVTYMLALFFVDGNTCIYTVFFINLSVLLYFQLVNFLRRPVHFWTVYVAIGFLFLGLSFKQYLASDDSGDYSYLLYHSLWHIFSALSCCLIIYAVQFIDNEHCTSVKDLVFSDHHDEESVKRARMDRI